MRAPLLSSLAAAIVLIALPPRAGAQCSLFSPDTGAHPLIVVGSVADESGRTAQDLGRCPAVGTLLRSSASLSPALPGSGFRWQPIGAGIREEWNSALPFSYNDGPVWAGRGFNTTLAGGVRLEDGAFSASIAPQVVFESNRPFSIMPGTTPGRSSFSSPWHGGIESADLPLRFGDQSIAAIYPGDSWVEYRRSAVAVGAATDEQWWGPGVQNALVLSNNAAGIPNVYLRSRRPLSTPIGDVEFRWELGALTESAYFDTVSTNDLRAFSAAVLTLRTRVDTGLTLGLARSVYSPVGSAGAIAGHAFDVVTRWNQSAAISGPTPSNPSDQLLSAFGRWVVPDAGVEFYAEWAKLFAPGLRQLLTAPQAHQGYTLGLEWAHRTKANAIVRVQGEASELEQTPIGNRQVTPIFYASRVVPQGYTQRGQIIGAALGPGSNGQWLSSDYVKPTWQAGAFVGRMRVEDEAMYLQPIASNAKHDVSIYSGVRGATRYRGYELSAQLTVARRLNYLFQSDAYNPSDIPPANTVDVQNVYLEFSIGPSGLMIR